MNAARVAGIVLLVLGAAGLIFSRVTYTEDRHTAELGPIDVSIEEKETATIPTWAGIAALVVGAGLLLVPSRKSA
jgi:hypothetical protein